MIDDLLRAYLSTLSLDAGKGAIKGSRACKLCGSASPHFDYVDFNRSCDSLAVGRSGLLVQYFRCVRCELLFTDFCDDWTPRDFTDFIYNDDYIVVDGEFVGPRPVRTAEDMSHALAGAENSRILDYGAGAGIFAREMMKRGFAHVESYDPFTHPTPPAGRFDLVTSFDVIEHSPRPDETIREIMGFLTQDGCAFVGQTLQPADIEEIRGDWWYLAPRNGHVTTYSSETLRLYCEKNGILYDEFNALFALSRPGRSALSETLIARRLPQDRRYVVHAPAGPGDYEGWDEEEDLGEHGFRWTRAAEVSFGLHPIPAGHSRIVIPHHGALTEDFLKTASIRIGSVERPAMVRDHELVALFNFPEALIRPVMLRTAQPVSPVSIDLNSDERDLGIAVLTR